MPPSLSPALPVLQDHPRFAELVRDVETACRAVSTLALLEAARPYFLAALAGRLGRPVLVVTGKPERARQLAEELRLWSTRPDDVLLFPEPDALPLERVPTDARTARERLAVLTRLVEPGAPAPLVVTTLRGLLHCVPRPERVSGAQQTVRVGQTLRLTSFLDTLLDLGYERVDRVELPGQFARRGGIVDVFPPTAEDPVRIEFFGDEVDSLRSFDPFSQRSTGLHAAVALGAARETLAAPSLDLDRFDLSTLADEERGRWERDFERLRTGESFEGIEYYAGLFPKASLLDYLAEPSLVVLEEPERLAALADDFARQAAELRRQFEGVSVPSGFPDATISWADLQAQLAGRAVLRLEPWAEDIAACGLRLADLGTNGPRSPDDARLVEGRAKTRQAASRTPHAATLTFLPVGAYGGRLRVFAGEALAYTEVGEPVLVVSLQAARLAEVLAERGVPAAVVEELDGPPRPGMVTLWRGDLGGGWQMAEVADEGSVQRRLVRVYGDADLFGFRKQRRALPRRRVTPEAFLAEIKPGEFVVHVEHGIARFRGLVRKRVDDVEREYLYLEYAAGDKLFVPVDQVDRVSRYVGASDRAPAPTRLGSQEWSRAKSRARRSAAGVARGLLQLYSAREVLPGRPLGPDTLWQREMEGAFPYVETPDQLEAIREVKADLERPRPMDRLVCGDVGYGKTEVAIRAAFKAVMAGKQVAVLVPTTVLAQQHYQTFRERLSAFPVRVEVLSRLRSEKEQAAVLEGLRDGSVDICIGTHRLVQKDVAFKDLGLLIIDEEQRFGVAHKERLRELRLGADGDGADRTPVHVLTMTATPIPRTLYMALTGVRDMSTIDTPPEERLPIRTYVGAYDDHLVREAILRELDRGGQVYFVTHRVLGIEALALKLRQLVPEAEVSVGHGQMPDEQLERAMLDFTEGRTDVLVCTTIIESGLDIPNANTIIIHNADRFGLAQLYQLRGRVGRGAARAYAYLLYEKHRRLSETAEKRLRTIFEASELGSGFRIALRDLEIRGAGNILGLEQSGHIGAVGFELYVQMLAEAVEELKAALEGAPPPARRAAAEPPAIELSLPALLPEDYVPDTAQRLALYQRMAKAETPAEVEDVAQELRDRFGPLPEEARNLLDILELRALGRAAGVKSIYEQGDTLVLQFRGSVRADRLALQRAFGGAVRPGPTQIRLDRERLGNRWRATLRDVLQRFAQRDACTELSAKQ